MGGIGEVIGGIVSGIAGPIQSHRSSEKLSREEMEFQRELARNSLGWKVEDARKHGISPLAAMGGQGHYGRGAVGSAVDSGSIQAAGQNIGRAVDSAISQKTRDKIIAENLRGKKLSNDLMEQELSRNRSNQPGMPDSSGTPLLTGGLPGQGDWQKYGKGYVVETPVNRPRSDPGDPSKEAGTVQDWTYVRDRDGNMYIIPSERMQQTIEEDMVQKSQWWLRNKISPVFKDLKPPNPKIYPPPKGHIWKWTGVKFKAIPKWRPQPRHFKSRKYRN